ncbi:hypothetical protein Tco_1098315 [Tanacetum coccineum]
MSNTNMQTQTSNALHNAIMEAGGKDRPSMLAPGNYVQWKSRIKRYIDTKPNNELIHYCLQNLPYKFKWTEKTVPVAEGSSETNTEGYMENYKNVSQDIRDQLNAEAEVVKQRESINVQDLETNLYWEFEKFTSRDGESLESYYSSTIIMYMAHIQEVTPDIADISGPIFDAEPLQKVPNDDDNYNVFDDDREYPEQPESVNEPYPDMCYDREQDD